MGINEELEAAMSSEPELRAKLEQSRRAQRAVDAQNATLLERIAELEKTLDFVEAADGLNLAPPKWMLEPASDRKKHATLALLLSDTHFDEVVEPSEINGLNAYNRRIAEQRLRAWAENAVKIARHYMSGLSFDGVVLMLGGDIFSGDIHEELKETNEDTVLGSLLHWSEQIAAAIDLVSSEFGKVHVPCVMGNHGRLSRKPRMKLRARTNLDWLLGKMLERHFAKNKNVTFNISDNADVLVPVYKWNHLLSHGDQVSGGGGIGGIWPPIMRMKARKAQRAMDVGTPFQTMWIGHWHQYISTPGMIVNGSLKGLDEYAWINNFGYEVPQQALAVVTPEHNITLQAPVFCQDRKKEKW